MASRDDFDQATQRAKELEARIPHAISAHYDKKNRRIVIELGIAMTRFLRLLPGGLQC